MEKESVSRKKIIVLAAVIVIVAAVVIALISGAAGGRRGTDPESAVSAPPETVMESSAKQAAEADETAETVDTASAETTGTVTKKAQEQKTADSKTTDADQKETAESRDEDNKHKQTCKLTINNGAASANTKEAVNGLHVYDPNSKDLEDFFSGQEVPVGTTVSIYVYNLASPVSLHVEHNGKVIADRNYSTLNAWVDDDKVEFINLVLEGDLVVQTTALSKNARTSSVISINNEALGKVVVGKEAVYDGNELRNGADDIRVERAETDVNVTLSVDGTEVGRATLTKNASSKTFRKVSFNNSKISVEFSPVDKTVKVPTAPKKSSVKIKKGKLAQVFRGTSPLKSGDRITNGIYHFKVVSDKRDVKVTLTVGGKVVGKKKIKAGMHSYTFKNVKVNGKVVFSMKDVTPKVKADKFRITIENKIAKSDGTITVGYVNEKEQAINIVSGKKYKKELMIGARALNYSSGRKLKLTAYGSDGKVLDSVTVKTGTKKNPGANGFYLLLTDHIRYVLEYADKEEIKEPETKPDTSAKQFSVTVDNKAAEANTDKAVNGLHVYDTADPDLEDISGSVKLKEGTKIRIYAYPLASDIHLKIVHNGKVVADKDIAKIRGREDDDKIEFFDLTLAGDLQVITTVKGSREDTTKETETKETETKETETTAPEEQYTVSIADQTGLDGLIFTVGYVDEKSGTPKDVVLKNGDKVTKGEIVGVRAGNTSSSKLRLKQLGADGKVEKEILLNAGTEKEPSYGGFYIDGVKGNISIILEKAE